MLPAGDGNISVRLDDDRFLITASGVSKGFLKPRQVLLVDGTGNVLDGDGEPSTEIVMHLVAYQLRGDVNAIVHSHPPFATAFACTESKLPNDLLSEAVIKVGEIPTAPFAMPSSVETAEIAAPFFRRADAILLRNHGAVALGKNLYNAFLLMELVEHIAKVAILSKIINGYEPIPPEALSKLKEMEKNNQ